MDLYSMDDLLQEQDLLEDISDHLVSDLKDDLEVLHVQGSRSSGPRRYVDRPREEANQRLMQDYFSPNPVYNDATFRRRFRMRRPLFMHIVQTLAIRQLATGSPTDQLDEYLKIRESTTVECLKMFVKGVIQAFRDVYLRRPIVEDVERLIQIGERRGFPGMLGSIDCMHWHWKKCPVDWKGQYTRGDHGVPMVILEAVASHDRWIWRAFFGVAGSNNDINVLNQSSLFVEQLRGEAPRVQYYVNGRQYNHGYYLADGIYPEWAVFVKSICLPQSDKHKLFTEHQEGARKDIECVFGILQSRFSILRRPARLYEQGDLENIMLACIILHNMIIEDEKDMEQIPLDLNETASTSTVEAPTISHGENPVMEEVLERNANICARDTHKQLQSDLVEHIWNKFGNQIN